MYYRHAMDFASAVHLQPARAGLQEGLQFRCDNAYHKQLVEMLSWADHSGQAYLESSPDEQVVPASAFRSLLGCVSSSLPVTRLHKPDVRTGKLAMH